MGLSISANGGNGLADLLRQARPTKVDDTAKGSADAPAAAVSVRPLGRSGIDSTGSGMAHVSAALTVHLAKLGGADETGGAAEGPAKTATVTALRPGSAAQPRSSVAELLRVLDAYGTGGRRLTA